MADGSILIDTKIDTSGAKKGVDGLEDELDGLGESSEEATKGIGDLWGQLFKADFFSGIASKALSAVGDALGEFVSGSIDAAADVKASNAQFSQTFKDIEKQATKSLDAISKKTGITTTRMQGSYTSIYAFAKTTGAESADALDIASRAMEVAADSAAYYDRSVEEVTESLQSFLKGNYENDAALGIAVTETTRNAKANEMYATSFDKLSESQKVDVLLAMVEAGNQASGALGQAAREADSWANVTGEAQEAMRQLQAVIGSPIMEALIPILQGITGALKELSETTASDELADSMKDFEDAVEDANEALESSEKEIERNAIMADHYKSRLKELEPLVSDSAEASREYANVVDALNELYPELNLQIDENTGLLNDNSDANLDNLDVLKQKYLMQAQEERYSAILEAQADAILAVQEAEAALVPMETERAAIEKQLAAISVSSADQLDGLTDSMYIAGTGYIALTDEANALLAEYVSLNDESAKLEAEIKSGNETIAQQDTELQKLKETLDLTGDSMTSAAEGQNAVTEATQETTTTVERLRAEYDAAKEAARNSIDAQIGLFDELDTESEVSAQSIIDNWGAQKEAFDNYAANLQAAVDMHLDDALVQQLSDGSEESMMILDEFVNGTDVSIDDINTAFEDVSASRDTVSNVMAEIQEDTSQKLDDLAADVENEWGDMAGTVGEEIAKMQEYINSLTGKTVYVDIVTTQSSGSYSGSSSGSASSGGRSSAIPYSVDMVSPLSDIPYLAEGAVIPPHAPFYAVLGDQQNGMNLEAPESLLRQIVREESGNQNGGGQYQFTAQINRRTLFDEMITEAQLRRIQSGRNPFEL